MDVGQRLRSARRSPALEIFLWSRIALWLAAVFALLVFEPSRHPDADRWDSPRLHELGAGVDVWARWDSDWYLRIAEHGYSGAPSSTTAFFPLYPGLVALLGRLLAGHYVLAGVLLSLAACAVAFVLLQRLARERLGEEGAVRAVLYLAIFPTALFLQAVYSESLYLALVLAAFLLADRSRFLGAGVATGLAMLTRPVGIALLPALALLAWRAEDRRRALLRLAVSIPIAAAYPLLLSAWIDEPFAFLRAQEGIWNRELSPAGPLGGLWEGIAVLFADRSSRDLALNVQQLAFTLAFLALALAAWRRFGAPYGLFALVSLAVPLSFPSERWPLLSMSRFGLVLFPLLLVLAALGSRPRLHSALTTVSAALLGVAVVQWALWQWVA
ncbi:MAG: glycosyltransferase family 39 protein [Gaiellaceae bacterium MAG52_C11]|nr:glycosyltransferase family 39 protein [Candidatus Gaiellasilicea maunaloa]